MEFFLLPYNRGGLPIPVPTTPYVCLSRYDGGPFMSYPLRVGRAAAGNAWVDLLEYIRSERVNPTPLLEQEAFMQTWLYFGLLSEFVGANHPTPGPEAKDILDRIYKLLVVEDRHTKSIFLDENGLNALLELGRSQWPKDIELQKKRYEHLIQCLTCAYPVLMVLPKTFNYTLKLSIAGLLELLSHTVRWGQELLGIPKIFCRNWGSDYLDNNVRQSMIAHGWCPSDISRAEIKFFSIQARHLIHMLDKRLPKKDHSRCTDFVCTLYQINVCEYRLRHEQENCSCEPLYVKSESLIHILEKEDRIPLLHLIEDDHRLSIEIVESSINTPYVAISHVWADGLGNPNDNALHRCKLLHLKRRVTELCKLESLSTPSLIWLDTLCCPAEAGRGKQMAIEKIRLVYERAAHVLVLDSSLMLYDAQPMDPIEQAARIFTSSWMRRLWTLQEAALANSLHFQFADTPISLSRLQQELNLKSSKSIRYKCSHLDITAELYRLEAFFHPDRHNVELSQLLSILDQALQYRSVSVPTDEPLCIGSLLSLDLGTILSVESREDRMRKVWELAAASRSGLPAGIIFLPEERLTTPGWRWAPLTLLSTSDGILKPELRTICWSEQQLGTPTPSGLQVQYPRFRIRVRQYEDGKPRKPWPGLKRIPETYMNVRDGSGQWYRISDKRYAFESKYWTNEQRSEHNALGIFPLHDLADTDRSSLVLKGNNSMAGDDGIIGLTAPSDLTFNQGIIVHTESYIIFSPLTQDEGHIYDIAGALALDLRNDELTNKHLQIFKQLEADAEGIGDTLKSKMAENEEFKVSVSNLERKMKDMMRGVMEKDEILKRGVKIHLGEDFVDDVWVLIQDWFNHDYIGEQLEEDQVWLVD